MFPSFVPTGKNPETWRKAENPGTPENPGKTTGNTGKPPGRPGKPHEDGKHPVNPESPDRNSEIPESRRPSWKIRNSCQNIQTSVKRKAEDMESRVPPRCSPFRPPTVWLTFIWHIFDMSLHLFEICLTCVRHVVDMSYTCLHMFTMSDRLYMFLLFVLHIFQISLGFPEILRFP